MSADSEPAEPRPAPSLPDEVSEISLSGNLEEHSGRDEWLTETDWDSGDSIFLTQEEPAPEVARPRRRRTFSSCSGFDGNVDGTLSSSSQNSQDETGGVKVRWKRRRLPMYNFPFLKGRKKKPRSGLLSVRENNTMHNSVTGGFFKSIKELWERNQSASDLQASLPTVDAEGEDITPLTEEEEQGSSDEDEDFWLADRRELLESCSVGSKVPWYRPPETISARTERPLDKVLVISDGSNDGVEEAPAGTPPPPQGMLARRKQLRRNRDDAPDAGEKEKRELLKAGTSWDCGASAEVASQREMAAVADNQSLTAVLNQEDQMVGGESNRHRTEPEDATSSTSKLKKKKEREKDNISVDSGEGAYQREDQTAASESKRGKEDVEYEALSSSRLKKKKKKKKKEVEQAEMSRDLVATVESRAAQKDQAPGEEARNGASPSSILRKKKKKKKKEKKKTKAESPDSDWVPECDTKKVPNHKRRKGKNDGHVV